MEVKNTVLALYPTRYGVAYALFSSPNLMIEFGIGNVQPINNRKVMKRVKKYIEHFKPSVIITRNLLDLKGRKSKRTQRLIEAICNQAKKQNLEVHSYSRTQIREVFKEFGAESKYEISHKIIEWFEELKGYEFPIRKKWMAENYNAGIFDAVSLAVVYWYNEN